MISTTLQDALNAQVEREYRAAFSYLAMHFWCETSHLCGFARWFYEQYCDELRHGYKITDYLADRGGTPRPPEIPAEERSFSGPLDCFARVIEIEEEVTRALNEIYAMGEAEHDYQTCEFLHWYLCNQVEEEATARDLHERLYIFGQDPAGLLMLDHLLGTGQGPGDYGLPVSPTERPDSVSRRGPSGIRDSRDGPSDGQPYDQGRGGSETPGLTGSGS